MQVNFKQPTHLRGEEIVKFIKNINIEEIVDKLGGLDLVKTGSSLQGNCPTGHISVSYTHLDVYKRQVLMSSTFIL